MRKTGFAGLIGLSLILASCSTQTATTDQAAQNTLASHPGATFQNVNWRVEGAGDQLVKAEVRDGQLLFQDDIVLGDADLHSQGTYTTNTATRWPNRTIPYTFNASLSTTMRDRIKQAITNIQNTTNVRLVARTSQADYIEFRPASGTTCSSSLGRVGGRQYVNLADRCTTGTIMHEVGHTMGLFHEQTRPDRDKAVRILWENIPADWQSQYEIRSGSAGYGAYDFDSIMHYPAYFDGKLAIQPLDAKIDVNRMGQRNGYSATDRAVINAMYP
ncbi:M12 family metallopeptidase [Deinococcus maricopensis]|uniref:Metallopeptidase n=1 Tax=Deinococcus maricopensis (strain DSM 21211 / LMG 22137 / NRRL B-23946 / LB-34) TaxID=709986 RepID=E8UAN3_DEIML|nr:M12 family metallopeptidase [Deinococcus maricopensis]ADV68122.1 metallopeptidase [Deinococcus maricopensis DSM 21211]